MTTNIIIPVDHHDGSLSALIPAKVLAGQTGGSLRIVSVTEGDPQALDNRLTGLRTRLSARGISDARIEIVPDDAGLEGVSGPEHRLLEVINEHPADLVCMTTHARGSAGEMVLGSVTAEVVRRSGRPIILVGPRFSGTWEGPIRTLLLCLDGSGLSEAMIQPAVDLAKALDARLFLLQVIAPDTATSAHQGDVGEWVYLRRTADLLRQKHGVEADWETLHDKNPARAIADFARVTPNAILAIGTHGRTGLSRLVMGSVARDVVHDATCPVLTMHPRKPG